MTTTTDQPTDAMLTFGPGDYKVPSPAFLSMPERGVVCLEPGHYELGGRLTIALKGSDVEPSSQQTIEDLIQDQLLLLAFRVESCRWENPNAQGEPLVLAYKRLCDTTLGRIMAVLERPPLLSDGQTVSIFSASSGTLRVKGKAIGSQIG